MLTIKDALDIINKLSYVEQESLKNMLLSPTFVKTLNIEEFVTKEYRVCPLCGCTHVIRNGLVWNNLVNYAKETDTEKINIFLSFVLATLKTDKCIDL